MGDELTNQDAPPARDGGPAMPEELWSVHGPAGWEGNGTWIDTAPTRDIARCVADPGGFAVHLVGVHPRHRERADRAEARVAGLEAEVSAMCDRAGEFAGIIGQAELILSGNDLGDAGDYVPHLAIVARDVMARLEAARSEAAGLRERAERAEAERDAWRALAIKECHQRLNDNPGVAWISPDEVRDMMDRRFAAIRSAAGLPAAGGEKGEVNP